MNNNHIDDNIKNIYTKIGWYINDYDCHVDESDIKTKKAHNTILKKNKEIVLDCIRKSEVDVIDDLNLLKKSENIDTNIVYSVLNKEYMIKSNEINLREYRSFDENDQEIINFDKKNELPKINIKNLGVINFGENHKYFFNEKNIYRNIIYWY